MLTELLKYKELLIAFTWRNIKIKYKQTFMGFLWAIFMPSIIIASGIIVRIAMAYISGKELQNAEVAAVAIKALPWAFFVGALKFSVSSLVANMNILGKIYFPRVIFPLSYVIGQLFDFIIALVPISLLIIFVFGIDPTINWLWFLYMIFMVVLFSAGWGMLLSCGNLFYRDVRYIIDVVLTFAILFTPVLYEARTFGEWETYLKLNPMGAMLESIYECVILGQMPQAEWLIYSTVWALVSFFSGWIIFHKVEPSFAENV